MDLFTLFRFLQCERYFILLYKMPFIYLGIKWLLVVRDIAYV